MDSLWVWVSDGSRGEGTGWNMTPAAVNARTCDGIGGAVVEGVMKWGKMAPTAEANALTGTVGRGVTAMTIRWSNSAKRYRSSVKAPRRLAFRESQLLRCRRSEMKRTRSVPEHVSRLMIWHA